MSALEGTSWAVNRPTLVTNINNTFGRANVQASVAGLPTGRGDFLTICRKAGVLGQMNNAQFQRYRARTDTVLPPLIQRILTGSFRAALSASPPIPLHIEINRTTTTSVEVVHTDQLISIVLNRPDPAPFPE